MRAHFVLETNQLQSAYPTVMAPRIPWSIRGESLDYKACFRIGAVSGVLLIYQLCPVRSRLDMSGMGDLRFCMYRITDPRDISGRYGGQMLSIRQGFFLAGVVALSLVGVGEVTAQAAPIASGVSTVVSPADTATYGPYPDLNSCNLDRLVVSQGPTPPEYLSPCTYRSTAPAGWYFTAKYPGS